MRLSLFPKRGLGKVFSKKERDFLLNGSGVNKYLDSINRVDVDRPVFIVGLQGGGLTLIRRILSKHADVIFCNGDRSSFWLNDEMQNEFSYYLPEEFKLFNSKYFLKGSFQKGGWMYGTAEYIEHFSKNEDDISDGAREHFMRVIKFILHKYSRNNQKTRFLDKSQSFGLKIPFINEMLKETNPKFLYIKTNPYLSVSRAINKPALNLLDPKTRLVKAIEHFENCTRVMLNDCERFDNCKGIKFEDFLDAPERVIKECCDFLELEFNQNMMPNAQDTVPDYKWYPIKKDQTSDRLKLVSDEIKFELNHKCSDLIEKMGYKLQDS